MSNIAKRHHYTPKFLLWPWCIESHDKLECAIWIDKRTGKLKIGQLGLKQVCCSENLLTLSAQQDKPDAVETTWFGPVDDRGAKVREKMLREGIQALEKKDREDWVRLLMSLESRSPTTVRRLRDEGAAFLQSSLDDNRVQQEGIKCSPSEFFDQHQKGTCEDRAVMLTQGLSDHPKVGRAIINAHWALFPSDASEQQFIIADRPWIRLNGYNDPNAVWAIPLTPEIAWIATANKDILNTYRGWRPGKLAKEMNRDSARQALTHVFTTNPGDKKWLKKYLKRPIHANTSPPLSPASQEQGNLHEPYPSAPQDGSGH